MVIRILLLMEFWLVTLFKLGPTVLLAVWLLPLGAVVLSTCESGRGPVKEWLVNNPANPNVLAFLISSNVRVGGLSGHILSRFRAEGLTRVETGGRSDSGGGFKMKLLGVGRGSRAAAAAKPHSSATLLSGVQCGGSWLLECGLSVCLCCTLDRLGLWFCELSILKFLKLVSCTLEVLTSCDRLGRAR